MNYLPESSKSDIMDENKLDIEFRQILCLIKQCIPYINSNYQLSLYSSWLEKLSTSDSEKAERNHYLLELARQIRNNSLSPPFNNRPPPGSLKKLPKINQCYLLNSKVSTEKFQFSPDFNPICHPNEHLSLSNWHYPETLLFNQIQRNHSSLMSSMQTSQNLQLPECLQTMNNDYNPCNATPEGGKLCCEKLKSPHKIKRRKSKSGRLFQKFPTLNQVIKESLEASEDISEKTLIVHEKPSRVWTVNEGLKLHPELQENRDLIINDSSWCDLTGTSVTSIINPLGSGDSEKNIPFQEKVQKFNKLSGVLEKGQAIEYIEASNTDRQIHEKCNVLLLSDSATEKTLEVNEMKLSLKDTNFISSDWKKMIESLQLRLTETLSQNNELKEVINSLQLKIKEESTKISGQNEIEQKNVSDLHKKEIEVLKKIQLENIKQLEKSFQIKLDEAEKKYCQKIEKLKISYETKVRELKMDHDTIKKEKDQEIFRLSEIIQHQCVRMSNEIAALRHQIENSFANNSEEKIIILQKCVSKMDKLFQKSEKEYQKQVDKLKHELDLKDKVTLIQLKTQRAELLTRSSVEKQKEFDEIVNNLEIKYIKMLEYHENQVMESKKQDEEKIEQLKDLLDRNDISYDIL